MIFIIKIILLSILGVVAIYLVKRLLFTAHTISFLKNKKNINDLTIQRQGMVFNKKTESLEADQSIIDSF